MKYFALFATLLVGCGAAITQPRITPFEMNIRKEIMEMNMEPMSLPDIEFNIEIEGRDMMPKIIMNNGKVEGMSKVIKPKGRCMERIEDDDIVCHLTIDGLRIIYEAISTNPDKKFNVEVIIRHSLIEMIIGKTPDGMMMIKNIRMQSMYPWVRRPIEFTDDFEINRMFDMKIKMKLFELLEEKAVMTKIEKAIEKVISMERFPIKMIEEEMPSDVSFIIGI